MFKRVSVGLLMTVALQAQAAYECNVKPQDDIIVSPQSVKIIGASGDLSISPNGDVTRAGKALTLSNDARQKAKELQTGLRREMPLLDSQIQQRLDNAKVTMDKIIVKEMGSDSKVRNHLDKLSVDLRGELSRILEKKDAENIIFHHQAIQQVQAEGQQKINQAMGAVIQDSVNEMGTKSINLSDLSGSKNPLKSMLGGLGNLQQAIRDEWKNQEKDFENFGKDACDRVTVLDMQRAALLSALPQS